MHFGSTEIASLVDTKAQLFRKHRFWWLVGLSLLVIVITVQYQYTRLFHLQQLQQVQAIINTLTVKEEELTKLINNIAASVPEQNERKHKKLSLLLRLLQKHMPEDIRLTTIEWQSTVRIEGVSLRRESISPLRTDLFRYGYFSDITLEQIRNQDEAYSFVLLVEFSDRLDLDLLQDTGL